MNGEFSRFNPQDLKDGANRNAKPHANPSISYTSSTAGKLKEKDRFSQAFNVLLNYWEIKPTSYEAKLQELALRDIKVVSAFVPWAHLETDIYHSLKKFVRAAWAV